MATGDLKLSPRGNRATLPPKRGRIMGLILEDLMTQKENYLTESEVKATDLVPWRGMIKMRILEELVQNEGVPSGAKKGNSTSPVPRRGMIKLRILDEFLQLLVPPAQENFDALG